MRGKGVKIRVILLAIGAALLITPSAQAQIPEAVTATGLDNQIYVGYEYTHYDYELITPQGDKQLKTNGVNVQYNYRSLGHLMITGTARYGSGPEVGQKMTTVGIGGGLVGVIWRAEPYVQVLAGMSRLTSTDNIYLSAAPATSFTYMVGGGIDFTVRGAWGVRPIYFENQYLSFGPVGSKYVNVGGGILYRFGSKSYGRHRNGL